MLLIALAAATASPSGTAQTLRDVIGVAAGLRCAKATADEIVVCGRVRELEQKRYRLPLPSPPVVGDPRSEAVFAERNRWLELGKTGIGSESPVGPGGQTGHNLNELKRRMDRNEGHPVRF